LGKSILAKSRRRKAGKSRSNPRSTYTPQKTPISNTKVVTLSIIIGVSILGVAYLLIGGGTGKEVTTKSGLKYIDLVEGTGASPRQGQPVSVHYTGTLENGTKFDSSFDRGEPYTFRLGVDPVIQGWVEGLMTMKVGGKRKLIIPPSLGYGEKGYGTDIPPNATLFFEIDLLRAQ
jgi:FKBP-type peptidyl-prolyl cis-trans isomerase